MSVEVLIKVAQRNSIPEGFVGMESFILCHVSPINRPLCQHGRCINTEACVQRASDSYILQQACGQVDLYLEDSVP